MFTERTSVGLDVHARSVAAAAIDGVTGRARGDEGNRRLHQRWVRFIDRKKKPTIANVAIARELAGWCWSLAVLEE